MSNPVTDAFFFGRALAEVFSEKLEESFTNAMSDLGKFDAEQRENLRKFVEEVELRAEQAAGRASSSNASGSGSTTTSEVATSSGVDIDIYSDDLQAMLDSLRAEIATLRAELKKYQD
ncbi:MAG: DUF6825 family protein [Cyanobacteria bacterium P01_G01_bin.19]